MNVLCASLLAGRLVHAIGVSQVPEPFALRVSGMVLTFGAIVAAALTLLMASFSH